jgi:hypothetical protein
MSHIIHHRGLILLLQVLEVSVMTQSIQVCLANRSVICASVPYPLNRLRNTNIIRFEFVEANGY